MLVGYETVIDKFEEQQKETAANIIAKICYKR